jgi:integrase
MPEFFSEQKARAYFDYCLLERGYSGKTHNIHLSALKAWFTQMLERNIIKVNPFTKIKELPEKMNENVAFTDSERKVVREHLKSNHKRLYYAVQFVYYCFLRRTELIELRVGDIDMERKSIRIPGRNAKNGRSESVTIPKSFEAVLSEMGVNTLPGDYYVFGHKLESCAQRLAKTDYFTDPHRRELRKISIRKDCTFYSWKHTGAMQLYIATKDTYVVMRQCRHTDISITMIYLRSLGLIVDEVVRNADFEF